MATNKNWYHKKRLAEQLKFFRADKQRFISEYAKKPRIRVENKKTDVSLSDRLAEMAPRDGYQLAAMQNQNLINLADARAQAQTGMANAFAQQNIAAAGRGANPNLLDSTFAGLASSLGVQI